EAARGAADPDPRRGGRAGHVGRQARREACRRRELSAGAEGEGRSDDRHPEVPGRGRHDAATLTTRVAVTPAVLDERAGDLDRELWLAARFETRTRGLLQPAVLAARAPLHGD